MKAFLKSVISFISQITEYHDFHPFRAMKRAALQDTVQYIQANMPRAIGFYHDDALLDYAVHSVTEQGCFLEFGVFKGRSIRRMAKLLPPAQKIHGFDSFEGLPEPWSGTGLTADAFSLKGRLPRVPANVELHRGLFDRTLPAWLLEHPEQASFIHIDCDLYSSTKIIFDLLGPRIKCGTILCFDEYLNYPNWREHEFKAFQEFVAQRKIEYEYIAYSWAQAAVRITKINQ